MCVPFLLPLAGARSLCTNIGCIQAANVPMPDDEEDI